MSARKKATRSQTQKTKKPDSTGRNKVKDQLPDLTPVYYAFCDAQALVAVAHAVIVDGDYGYGPEESVLRMGVEALDRVSDQLEEAERQINRFRRKEVAS